MRGETDIAIRPASEADLPAVLQLCAQLGEVPPIDTATVLFERFKDYPDYVLYVAEQAGEVVGSFALLVMHNLAHLGAPSGIVEDVVVAPHLHGHGVGTAMMQFAMQLCYDKGCYKLVLSSNAKRESAHAFYDALGFARHGVSFRCDLQPVSP
jgi:GNAT superfamily N-acetyltransferase